MLSFCRGLLNVHRVMLFAGACCICFMILRDATLRVLDNPALTSLSTKASLRLHRAFRPKTYRAYDAMFRTFIAFCIITKCALFQVNVRVILSFMECLVKNSCSPCMVANYVSAIRASFVLYELPHHILDHPRVKYFFKSLRINRPVVVIPHNIITTSRLIDISVACDLLTFPQVFRAAFLLGFFAFLRLSNLVPHAVAEFDHTRHLAGNDIFFTHKYVKIMIKWSKTMQSRDRVQCVTIPKLKNKVICPYRALKQLFKLYPMSGTSPLFQVSTANGLVPLSDSKVRKALKMINIHLGLRPNFFTFHDFRRSGATFAYQSHIPMQEIKRHGTWSSDCVWGYIQSDHSSGESLADAFANALDAS